MAEGLGFFTWPEAVDFCLSKEAALASFQNKNEENALVAVLRKPLIFTWPTTHFFFGLIRRPTSATGVYSYQLPDGSPITFAHWNRLGTLNDENACGKIVVSLESSTVHWKAQSCSAKLAFFCKKPRSERRTLSCLSYNSLFF